MSINIDAISLPTIAIDIDPILTLSEKNNQGPISRFLRMGSDTLQWAASKAHSLYTKRSFSSTAIQGRDKAVSSATPLTPVVEEREFLPTNYTGSLASIEEGSPELPLLVKGSPDIVSTRELGVIPESPRAQTPSPHLGIDNKESGFVEGLETSSPQPATGPAIDPVTAKPDTNAYVTVKDFNRYLSQFNKMDLPDLSGNLDSRVKRQDLIGYIRLNFGVTAPDFVNDKEYFTRQELVHLVAQIIQHFSPKENIDRRPLEPLRSLDLDRDRLRSDLLAKKEEVPTKISTVNSNVPVKKATGKSKSTHESNDSAGTKTNSLSGKGVIQERGASVLSHQSEVEFSKIKKNDGDITRVAKKVQEVCDSFEIDRIKYEKQNIPFPFDAVRTSRIETYLLLDKDIPLQPPGPGAGQSISSQNDETPSRIED